MQCEICGGALAKGEKKCPRCGASVANLSSDEPSAVAPPVAATPSPRPARSRVEPTAAAKPKPAVNAASAPKGATDSVDAAPARRRSWGIAIGLIVVVVVLITAGVLVVRGCAAAASPDVAAVRMLTALGKYDAQGVLDNATHASLTATDIATFAKQMAEQKTTNNGLPTVKDIVVRSVKPQDSSDATMATVQLGASWLNDPTTKKYTERDEILTVVKQDGRWLVRLFP